MTASRSIEAASPDRAAILCPVCGSVSETTADVDGWGTWQRCMSCALSFADPLVLPKQPEELFDHAYRGTEQTSGFHEFAHRVRQRDALIVEPELWFWTPAFGSILDWLDLRIGRGGPVLEIGCGLGFFLHALRRRGFDPVGVDVARTAVELNRRDGFDVWHGTVDSIPDGWVHPAAIVSMFMLHHVQDPLGFLRTIRRRWPTTPLAIAQYGPSNRYEFSAMPPRNLTRWNASALETALVRAGYRATVRDIPANALDGPAMRGARRLAFERLIRFPAVYRLGKRAVDRIVRTVARPDAQGGFVLLALAEPDHAVAPAARVSTTQTD